ncbi:MAG: RNA polymerase sigma factor [Actinomycetota bacterium]
MAEAAASGDERAAADLVAYCGSDIVRYCARRGSADAEALANLVFAEFYGALPRLQFDVDQQVWAYLYRIARNRLIDEFRRPSQEIAPDLLTNGVPTAHPDPADGVVNREWMSGLVSSLSEEQRQVIELRFGEELSLAETAQRTGKSVGAVKALQHRAFAALGALVAVGVVIAIVALSLGADRDRIVSVDQGPADQSPTIIPELPESPSEVDAGPNRTPTIDVTPDPSAGGTIKPVEPDTGGGADLDGHPSPLNGAGHGEPGDTAADAAADRVDGVVVAPTAPSDDGAGGVGETEGGGTPDGDGDGEAVSPGAESENSTYAEEGEDGAAVADGAGADGADGLEGVGPEGVGGLEGVGPEGAGGLEGADTEGTGAEAGEAIIIRPSRPQDPPLAGPGEFHLVGDAFVLPIEHVGQSFDLHVMVNDQLVAPESLTVVAVSPDADAGVRLGDGDGGFYGVITFTPPAMTGMHTILYEVCDSGVCQQAIVLVSYTPAE